MNKYLLVAMALTATALAAPQQQHQQQPQEQPQEVQPAQILSHESGVGPDGYHFAYETSDGIYRQEQGALKLINEDVSALTVNGNYRYTAPDGLVYQVTYIANEHGFQPSQHVEHPQQAA